MKGSFVDRWRRLRDDPRRWEWLSSGLVGGLSGGAGTAWLFWGWPHLLRDEVCFVFWLAAGIAMLAFACATGVSFVMLVQWTLKALRRLRTPPAYAMWEPPEPVAELDLGLFSHPGCAIALYMPLIGMSGLLSMAWVYLAFRQVAFWRVLLMAVLGLPVGIAMARSEAKGLQRGRGVPQ